MAQLWVAFSFAMWGALGGAIFVTHTDLTAYQCVPKGDETHEY